MAKKKRGDNDNDEEEMENEASIVLQCFIRCVMSKIKVKKKARITWKRIFDPAFDVYFWYNSINGSPIKLRRGAIVT